MLRSRLPRLALAAAAAGTVAVVPPDPSKLPLHSTPSPPLILLETPPSRLEQQIGVARRAVTEAVRDAHAKVQSLVDRWIGVEHAVENRVKSIISPSEPLTPGILYVGIATLTGSIISRSRGLPSRIALPPVLFLVSLQHFLPQTTANLGSYISSVEQAHFPALAEKHQEAGARLRTGWASIQQGTREGNEKVVEVVDTALKRLQGITGLKLQETFGLRQGVVSTTREKVSETTQKVADVPSEINHVEKGSDAPPAIIEDGNAGKATKLV